MTIEDYNTATNIITKIQELDDCICNIKYLTQTSDTTEWVMAVRPNKAHSFIDIKHEGLLPEFLNMALSKLCEERKNLKEKLEEL